MKFNNKLKFIVLMLISSGIYAQDFYSYNLFDKNFQAVFPEEPSAQYLPKELLEEVRVRGLDKPSSYEYIDKTNQISFTAVSAPSQLEQKNYLWNGIKDLLDDLIKKRLKADNRKLINFSSTLDKKKSSYIAIYTTSFFMEGQKRYLSTKRIYFKDKVYQWSVGYVNKADGKIFDEYKKYSKVIK